MAEDWKASGASGFGGAPPTSSPEQEAQAEAYRAGAERVAAAQNTVGGPTPPGAMPMAGEMFGSLDADSRTFVTRFPGESYSSGAIPTRFRQRMTGKELTAQLSTLKADEILVLKQRLWYAGYYGEEAVAGGTDAMPRTLSVDDEFVGAFAEFLADASQANVGPDGTPAEIVSLDRFLSEKMQATKPLHDYATKATLNIGTQAQQLRAYGSKLLGRDMTEAEVQSVVDAVFADGANTAASAKPDLPQLLTGGGPESTAIKFGRQLAARFGLTTTREFTARNRYAPHAEYADGLGFSVGGDPDDVAKLAEWAEKEGIFAKVDRVERDGKLVGLDLVVNDGAQAPLTEGVNATANDGVGRFLAALKRPGGQMAYNWQGEGRGRRGAYGISDEIYNYYSAKLGIGRGDSNPTPEDQDRVAAAYARDLWSRYGDWRTAAVAFRKTDGAADALARNDTSMIDDADNQWLDDFVVRMANTGIDLGRDPFAAQFGTGDRVGWQGGDVFAPDLSSSDGLAATLRTQFERQYAPQISASKVIDGVMKMMQVMDSYNPLLDEAPKEP